MPNSLFSTEMSIEDTCVLLRRLWQLVAKFSVLVGYGYRFQTVLGLRMVSISRLVVKHCLLATTVLLTVLDDD